MTNKHTSVHKSAAHKTTAMLGKTIVQIREAAQSMRDSGFGEETIVILLHDQTNISKKAIRAVLDDLKQL